MRTLSSLLLAILLASGCGSVTTIGGGGGGQGGTSGQNGRGGSGGSGKGTGGTGGESCAQIETAYATALQQAKSCSLGASNQCQQTAPSSLACGCDTFVNDRSMLDTLQSRWNQANCQNGALCPAIACIMPKSASCRATDAGGPACADNLLTP